MSYSAVIEEKFIIKLRVSHNAFVLLFILTDSLLQCICETYIRKDISYSCRTLHMLDRCPSSLVRRNDMYVDPLNL